MRQNLLLKFFTRVFRPFDLENSFESSLCVVCLRESSGVLEECLFQSRVKRHSETG